LRFSSLSVYFLVLLITSMINSKLWLLVVILCLFTTTSYAQKHTTGIFASIKLDKKYKAKGYGRKVYNRTHRERFQIPENPLIEVDEFLSVSKITHDLNQAQSYFDIAVSAEGMTRLRSSLNALPNTELILLIDNTVFGSITSKSEADFRFNKITIEPARCAIQIWIGHTKNWMR
jgi:hypothetical protein